jgi:hypothetical protein
MARRAILNSTPGTFAGWLMAVLIDPVSIGMKTYEFDVILKDTPEPTDQSADALFEAGCDDGTLASRDGTTWIHFDRESSSLEEAIRSAVTQVQFAGLVVFKVELDVTAALSV